jgi:hypothetical protein
MGCQSLGEVCLLVQVDYKRSEALGEVPACMGNKVGFPNAALLIHYNKGLQPTALLWPRGGSFDRYPRLIVHVHLSLRGRWPVLERLPPLSTSDRLVEPA